MTYYCKLCDKTLKALSKFNLLSLKHKILSRILLEGDTLF